MTGEQDRADSCRTGTDNQPRNPGQNPPVGDPLSMSSSTAVHRGLPSSISNTAYSMVVGKGGNYVPTPVSSLTPGQRMGNQALMAVTGSAVDLPSSDRPVDLSQQNNTGRPSWRELRESTLAIRIIRSELKFTPDTAYDWIEQLGFNPKEFTPRAAGLVNRNSEFHITFNSKEQALKVAAAAGESCIVSGIKRGDVSLTDSIVHHMKIQWLPAWIENATIKDRLEQELTKYVHARAKVRVVKNATLKSKWGITQTTYREAIVTVPMDAEIERTPGSMQIWTGNKMNEALIVVKGLEPKCLKCDRRGHLRTECPYPCRRCQLTDEQESSNTPGKWNHKESEHEEWRKAMEDAAEEEERKKVAFEQQKVAVEQQKKKLAQFEKEKVEADALKERERKLAENRKRESETSVIPETPGRAESQKDRIDSDNSEDNGMTIDQFPSDVEDDTVQTDDLTESTRKKLRVDPS